MEPKKFYDIHFHAMDLSHANITSFVNRFIEDASDKLSLEFLKNWLLERIKWWHIIISPIVLLLPIIFLVLFIIIRIKKIKAYLKSANLLDKVSNVRNLLTFMESSIIYDFLVLDYFLKKGKENRKDAIVSENNEFNIGEIKFNKIVLCPLIMDFGFKNITNKDIFYNIPPQKPIRRQITDLFEAIRIYYGNELSIKTEDDIKRFRLTKIDFNPDIKLFEIYPFMGLNTQNYTLEKVKKMLNKYFGEFDGTESKKQRQKNLFDQIGKFKGDFNDEKSCKNIFAGIKVYPPLGFEPWPDDAKEREKVEWLYSKCIEKRIPIITHCSTGGFKADQNYKSNTNPGDQWNEVLQNYPGLKLDFAHFGSDSKQWRNTIIDLATKEESSVYTDFSCNTKDDVFYKKLNDLTKEHPELKNKVLFGSDFMINLLWSESYNEYLNIFMKSAHLTDDLKLKLVNENSEKFLFE